MSEENNKIIKVGSRKSELALIQTKYVVSCLQNLFPSDKFEIHTMTTIGDRVLNKSLPKIGEKSLFTKDLEDALRNGGVDFVVHSLKDLPTCLPIGMTIGTVLERKDPRDALVLNEKYRGKTLKTLPEGSIIGTSSLRRSAQLARDYPHLIVCDIRGNLNTRLAKLDAVNSKFSGIILAQAGLVRMGWENRIDQILEPNEILYAVGQGALAVECRSNDNKILSMLDKLSNLDTQCCILAERSFLRTLGGGCSAPVAVCTSLKRRNNDRNLLSDYELNIIGAVWSLDGKEKIENNLDCIIDLDKNDFENDVIPKKKRCINNGIGDDEEYINNNLIIDENQIENDKIKKNRRSPEIIDDSKASCSKYGAGDSTKLDIEQLISVHSELFKKCPYSMEHLKEKSKVNTTKTENTAQQTATDGCPLNIPIGQDFMGECPYFDTEQKVEIEDKCPITGNVKKNPEDTTTKCPFVQIISTTTCKNETKIFKSSESENNNNNNNAETVQGKIMQDKCPFLKENSVKLIEYDENNLLNNNTPILIDNCDKLYCGMFCHKTINKDLFDKCQNVGIDLANLLIKKGALEIMNVAQQEIRQNIN